MTRVRAKNINEAAVSAIVEVLDGWGGKLTWELLIDAVEKRTKLRYTRQALHRHERIQLAFETRKKALIGQSGTNVLPDGDGTPPELKLALQQIERLKGTNQRLEAENTRLLEQFAHWAYNAHTRNLTKEFLNTPLPNVNREQSNRLRQQAKALAGKKD
jgi:hypothetical protein